MPEAFGAYTSFAQVALLAGLAAARISVAFLLLPIFAPDTVPPMVRNAVFVALAVLTLALQPPVDMSQLSAARWIALFAKEALLGLVLGFGLAAFLWAFEAAGHIVDTKIAVANGALPDAMTGEQLTPTAVLLSRLASFLFMITGGFMLFVGVLIESYRVFPLAQVELVPRIAAVGFFERHFADLMALALLIAAPAIVVMFALDLALGLVNRYAPQLNLVSVSMSLKGVAGIAVWMLVLGNLVQGFGGELARRIAQILPSAQRLFGG